MIEKPVSKFGLLGDLGVLKSRIERNVRLAAGTVHNLRVAAEAGEISKIPQAELVRLLTEVQEALDAVAA